MEIEIENCNCRICQEYNAIRAKKEEVIIEDYRRLKKALDDAAEMMTRYRRSKI